MKKVFLFFLAAVIFTGSIFAGGGGTFEYTWYALNLENGKGFYICQCSYVSTEVCGGQHKITFDKRGCVLNVSEYDEDGKQIQDSTETFAQDKKVPY
ncbi:MAG: hypothetical protein SPJ44_00320, partial [Treponema sp.]|nr:hypothetical protein [Treponema sp.]